MPQIILSSKVYLEIQIWNDSVISNGLVHDRMKKLGPGPGLEHGPPLSGETPRPGVWLSLSHRYKQYNDTYFLGYCQDQMRSSM